MSRHIRFIAHGVGDFSPSSLERECIGGSDSVAVSAVLHSGPGKVVDVLAEVYLHSATIVLDLSS
jgi:hypothetical protein